MLKISPIANFSNLIIHIEMYSWSIADIFIQDQGFSKLFPQNFDFYFLLQWLKLLMRKDKIKSSSSKNFSPTQQDDHG